MTVGPPSPGRREQRVGERAGQRLLVDLLAVPAEQVPVRRAAQHQLLVGAGVDDAPAHHHGDGVGEGEGAAPVRDQDGGPVGGQPVQGAVDGRLGGRVDRAGGVVQDQHPGIGDHRPGQRQPLPLPAGQRQAAFADHRVVAVRQGQR